MGDGQRTVAEVRGDGGRDQAQVLAAVGRWVRADVQNLGREALVVGWGGRSSATGTSGWRPASRGPTSSWCGAPQAAWFDTTSSARRSSGSSSSSCRGLRKLRSILFLHAMGTADTVLNNEVNHQYTIEHHLIYGCYFAIFATSLPWKWLACHTSCARADMALPLVDSLCWRGLEVGHLQMLVSLNSEGNGLMFSKILLTDHNISNHWKPALLLFSWTGVNHHSLTWLLCFSCFRK